jgi:hypothetical protein
MKEENISDHILLTNCNNKLKVAKDELEEKYIKWVEIHDSERN